MQDNLVSADQFVITFDHEPLRVVPVCLANNLSTKSPFCQVKILFMVLV